MPMHLRVCTYVCTEVAGPETVVLARDRAAQAKRKIPNVELLCALCTSSAGRTRPARRCGIKQQIHRPADVITRSKSTTNRGNSTA